MKLKRKEEGEKEEGKCVGGVRGRGRGRPHSKLGAAELKQVVLILAKTQISVPQIVLYMKITWRPC